MRAFLAAITFTLLLASTQVSARQRHDYHHHHHSTRDEARGRPSACAGIPWCGCWLRHHLGLADVRLNRAIAWARIGSPASAPAAGIVAVWRHHVGLITENLGGGMIRILSGNDGGAVRERAISTRALGGVVAYRKV